MNDSKLAGPVQVFLTVFLRPQETKECLETLLPTLSSSSRRIANLWVYLSLADPQRWRNPANNRPLSSQDIEAQAQTIELLNAYQSDGSIDRGIVIDLASQSEVYWSKNYAWHLFLRHIQSLPESARRYIVMLDNDVYIRNSAWLTASVEMLTHDRAEDLGVKIISPYDGPPWNAPGSVFKGKLYDGSVYDLAGVACELRNVPSRCWVMKGDYPYSFVTEDASNIEGAELLHNNKSAAAVITPTWRAMMRNGRPDRMPTDLWYWQQMKARKEFIAVWCDPAITNPRASWRSARRIAGVGGGMLRELPQ